MRLHGKRSPLFPRRSEGEKRREKSERCTVLLAHVTERGKAIPSLLLPCSVLRQYVQLGNKENRAIWLRFDLS
jgi:hypothetical protein